jgi:hypothetical protein
LIEKAKKTSDKQTIEILLKWEISNKKLMEKYQSAETVNGEDPEGLRVIKEAPDVLMEDQPDVLKKTNEPISEEDLEESMVQPSPKKIKKKKQESENEDEEAKI